jgi:hypothetical protein
LCKEEAARARGQHAYASGRGGGGGPSGKAKAKGGAQGASTDQEAKGKAKQVAGASASAMGGECFHCGRDGDFHFECPNDPVCVLCGKEGHVSANCPTHGRPMMLQHMGHTITGGHLQGRKVRIGIFRAGAPRGAGATSTSASLASGGSTFTFPRLAGASPRRTSVDGLPLLAADTFSVMTTSYAGCFASMASSAADRLMASFTPVAVATSATRKKL